MLTMAIPYSRTSMQYNRLSQQQLSFLFVLFNWWIDYVWALSLRVLWLLSTKWR